MKKLTSILIAMLVSVSSHAALIDGANYTTDDTNNYWTNIDLSLDVMRLDWADTLGGSSSQQKSFDDYDDFVNQTQHDWRWATGAELFSILNWFDTDPVNQGWSAEQNIGINLFFSLNGYGPKYYGTGTNGEVYQNGYDHEGYTYWQFGTMLNNTFEYTWVADFGDQVSAFCPAWSVLCNSGYLDIDTPHGFTLLEAMQDATRNIAPLLVRTNDTATNASNVTTPLNISLFLTGLLGLVLYRRR
jgi:hypothetical protein